MNRLQDAERLDGQRDAIARQSKVLHRIFLVIFIGYILCGCAILALMAFGAEGLPTDPLQLAAWGVPLLLTLIIGGLILFTILQIFRELSCRRTPFTATQIRRILWIGILLTVDAILEFFISFGYSAVVRSQGLEVGFVSPYTNGNIYINLVYIIAALICFCLFYVFRYGSLLQWYTDETV